MSDINAGIASAINAYNAAARGEQKTSGNDAAAGVANDDFATLVRSAIDEAVKIGERSETLSVNAISDRADLSQVVTAVAEAEVTLQTVVAVRDKVLESYKEIIRMPM